MTNPKNWPNPERPGTPMFPNISARHVLENKRRRSLKLVLWDHEQEHYCTEVGYLTPGGMVAMDWEYYAPCLPSTQMAELLTEERERCLTIVIDEQWNFPSSPINQTKESAVAFKACERIIEKIRNLGAVP